MVPNFQVLMLPLLQHIADGKEYNIKNAVTALITHFDLSDDDRMETTAGGGKTKIYDRTQWAKTYLLNAGLVTSSHRGLFNITPKGVEVLKSNVEHIDIDFLNQYPEFVKFQNRKAPSKQTKSNQSITTAEQDPQTTLADAYATINKVLANELMDIIMSKDPYAFEQIVVELLVKMGYSNEDSRMFVTKKSGDSGVDGIIRMDKLGFDRIGVQAKRWDREKAVGRPEVQAFAGALGGMGIRNGVFFTTARFSEQAKQYSHTGIKIVLIDGEELAKLMVTYNVGVQIERTLEFKKIDSDFFDLF